MAIKSGCGNCQEMAYAGALILRFAGFKGKISIGQFGINHQFLIIDGYFIDTWAGKFYPKETWRDNLMAYGGSIRDGVLKGRLLPPTHEELEDDEPEVVEDIEISILSKLTKKQRWQLHLCLHQKITSLATFSMITKPSTPTRL